MGLIAGIQLAVARMRSWVISWSTGVKIWSTYFCKTIHDWVKGPRIAAADSEKNYCKNIGDRGRENPTSLLWDFIIIEKYYKDKGINIEMIEE